MKKIDSIAFLGSGRARQKIGDLKLCSAEIQQNSRMPYFFKYYIFEQVKKINFILYY